MLDCLERFRGVAIASGVEVVRDTCGGDGLGKINVCGRKSGRPCMDHHVSGKPLKHSAFQISIAGKSSMLEKRSRALAEDADDEDDEDINPIRSPLRQSPRARGPHGGG